MQRDGWSFADKAWAKFASQEVYGRPELPSETRRKRVTV